MDDFSILGLASTRDSSLVKEAFRAKAKELHPDIVREGEGAEERLERHFRFIALTQAYRRALDACRAGGTAGSRARAEPVPRPAAASAGPAARAPSPAAGSGALELHRDPAYALYKTGIRYYMSIHPSAWEGGARVAADDPSARGREDEEARAKVLELIKLFPKAYYYFGLVATEYPDSPWAADACDKMAAIERRGPAYKRIVESFGAWRRAGKARGQEVEAIVERTRRALKDEGGEMRWPGKGGGRR